MQEKNNQTTIKILIGIIIGLSVFILLGGIFYIFNMQSKLTKLETEQEEQLKRQVETQNMASVQSIQTQPDIQAQQTTINTTNKKNNISQSSSMKGAVYITKSTSGPVNVREKATMNSKILTKLPDNINLKYINRNGNWYYVSYNINGYDEYGYINKSQLASPNSKKNQNIENHQIKNKKVNKELLEKCKDYLLYTNYSDYEIEKDIEFKYRLEINPPTYSELGRMNALQTSTNAKLKAADEIFKAKICKRFLNRK